MDNFIKRDYDIFVSYSHIDNDEGLITTAVDKISSVYRKVTGDDLHIFFDTSEIVTSQLWESKIKSSLLNSKMLLAFISPSYIKSEWCREEWEITISKEESLRTAILLPEHVGIIFPILLHPLKRGHFNPSDQDFVSDTTSRQFFDISGDLYNPQFLELHIRTLVEQLVDSIDEVSRLTSNQTAGALDSELPDIVIIDRHNGLMWTGFISDHPMELEEAHVFAASLTTAGFADWRLPTVDELKTTIDRRRVEDDPFSEAYPYVEPFNVRRSGAIFSSDLNLNGVAGEPGYYVMNLRNAHIYNGAGTKAYVRAVRRLD